MYVTKENYHYSECYEKKNLNESMKYFHKLKPEPGQKRGPTYNTASVST